MKAPFLQDDAFIADVDRTRQEQSHGVRIWWLGQSGFLVQHRGRHLLFDPYLSESLTKKYASSEKPHERMVGRVVAPQQLAFVDVVTSTHSHTDHLDAETLVPLVQASAALGKSVTLVVPAATVELATHRLAEAPPELTAINAGQHLVVKGFDFHAVPAAHDQLTTDERGQNLYLGYVVRVGDTTIYHGGDTIVYPGMADVLRPLNIDIALLPINGMIGNMNGTDAGRLAFDIGAKLVIPCHYDLFEFNTASPDALFIPECRRLGQQYKVLRAGEGVSWNDAGEAK